MTHLERGQPELWDEQLADDLASGLLDGLLVEVDLEIEAGLAKPLPPSLMDTSD